VRIWQSGRHDALAPKRPSVSTATDARSPDEDVVDGRGAWLLGLQPREDEAWLCATAQVLIGSAPAVTDTAQVENPTLIVVEPLKASGSNEGDSYSGTRAVLVAEPDRVHIFDAHLKPCGAVPGLKQPKGMCTDEGDRIYIADSGNNRILRTLGDGQLDPSFGTAGVFHHGEKPDPRQSLIGLGDTILPAETRAPQIAFINGASTLVECSFGPVPDCSSQTLAFEPKRGRCSRLLSSAAPRTASPPSTAGRDGDCDPSARADADHPLIEGPASVTQRYRV